MPKLVRQPRKPYSKKSRHLEGFSPWADVQNFEPDRLHVVLANRELDEHIGGVAYYERIGYKPVLCPKQGERKGAILRSARDAKPGGTQEAKGLVLMGMPIHSDDPDVMDLESLNEWGPDGSTGLNRTRELEKRIVRRGAGVFDPASSAVGLQERRGQRNYAYAESDITPLTPGTTGG